MATGAEVIESCAIEMEITAAIKAGRLRLRSDKVAQRLSGALKAGLADVVPVGRSLVITVTAPIRHPAKTAEGVEQLVRDSAFHDDGRRMIWGNQVCVREVTHNGANAPKVLVFVHNPESEPGRILDIAVSRILQQR